MTAAGRPAGSGPAAGLPKGSGPAAGLSPGSGPAGELSPGSASPPRRSGLRSPQRAVAGLGAGLLSLEALVLVLAIQPIRVVGGGLSAAAIAAVVTLAVVAVLLAGMIRRAWAWSAGVVLQGALLLAGALHWSLLVLGVIFGLVWAYALHVRRVILG